MWPLKTIFYFSLFWIGCVVSLVNPIWGIVNYMMAYQTNPSQTWWGIPLVKFGMRFSMFAATFLILGLLFSRKRVPKVKPGLCSWELGILALVLLGAMQMIFVSAGAAESLYAFEKLWKMMLFVLILGRLATTRANLKLVIATLVLGSLLVGYDAYTAPPSSFVVGRLELIGGPDFSSSSGAAAHLAAMLPIIGIAFLTAKHWPSRIFALVAGGFTFNAIILCRTRSAFIGLLVGLVAAALAAPRARRFRIRALLGLGLVASFALTDSHFWNRMRTLTDRAALAADVATTSRTEIWWLSLEIIRDHPFGIGPGNFPSYIGAYNPKYYRRSAHNTIVVCFTEFGIPGGILFLLLVGCSLRYLLRSIRLARTSQYSLESSLIAYGFLVAFVTYFTTGLGTERFYCESFWWILTLPVCLYRVLLSEAYAPSPALALEPVALEDTWEEKHAEALPAY